MNVKVVELASGLANPWSLAFLPDGKLLVTQRSGQLRLRNSDGTPVNGGADQVSGLPAIEAVGQGGLLDVVVDPAFASNRRIYFSYAERDGTDASFNGTAVARAELDTVNRSLSGVVVIYRQLPKAQSSAHFGSRLVFDRSGHLFVTLGERLNNDQRGFSQDLTRGHGKVMRITTDGQAAPGNPNFGVVGAQPHIWSYGHRNVQGAALHPATGELWVNEHGPQGGDEVNVIEKGRNYGWPVIGYGVDYGGAKIHEATRKAGMEQPLKYWVPSIAPSGMAFYTGGLFPAWKGNLFIGALRAQLLVRLELDGEKVTKEERLLTNLGERIRDVRQGPDGALWLLTDNANGRVLRVTPARKSD